MKSINVDEKDLDELRISTEHISLEELEKQILIQSLRKQRKELEKINIENGFDKLTEEEIFDIVNEAEAEYKKDIKP